MKPCGTFRVDTFADRPAWASFLMIASWDDLAAAARLAEQTGIRFALALYGISPYDDVTDYATRVKADCDRVGLTPHLAGVVYHEEWYEQVLVGGLPVPGIDHRDPAYTHALIETAHGWIARQHRTIKRVFPTTPIVWLTGLVNDSRAYGDYLWRPVPEPVDVIALEAYVPKGQQFNAWADLAIAHCARTRPEPIVLVLQAWRDAEGDWSDGPTVETIAGVEKWMRDPKVWGAWLFTWDDRPNVGITGIKSMPAELAAYEKALGIPRELTTAVVRA